MSFFSRTPSRRKQREALTGYLFILPATLLIVIFGLFPILYALYMSLYRWRVAKGRFIELEHYLDTFGSWPAALALAFFGGLTLILVAHWLWTDALRGSGAYRALKLVSVFVLLGAGVSVALGWQEMINAGDDTFWTSLIVTLFYAFGTLPLQITLALFIAVLLHQKLRGQTLFRVVFFLQRRLAMVCLRD